MLNTQEKMWINCSYLVHFEADCWQKEENKSKRPNENKIPDEMANSALGHNQNDGHNNNTDSRVEYLLRGLTFPTEQKILLDP